MEGLIFCLNLGAKMLIKIVLENETKRMVIHSNLYYDEKVENCYPRKNELVFADQEPKNGCFPLVRRITFWIYEEELIEQSVITDGAVYILDENGDTKDFFRPLRAWKK